MITLRRSVAALTCTVIFATSIPSPVLAAELPFPDMEQSWFVYRDSVAYLKGKNVISGYEDGSFKPSSTVNRAEFLKIVFAARGGPTPSEGATCFSDVIEGSWYAPYVCAASRRGIVQGYPDGSFHPDQPVNIAEALKIVVGAYGHEPGQEKPGHQWYETYTDFLDRTEILRRSSYLPWETLSRERAADLIVRLLRYEDTKDGQDRSKGCSDPGRVFTSLTVDGVETSFLLTSPRNATSDEPHPLVIAFHGRTNSAERVRGYYGLDRAFPDAFIAYPEGRQTSPGSYTWVNTKGKPDVALFDAIVEQIANAACIDLDRIYVVGHSLGAWMANSMACLRGGQIRASATVGGDGVGGECTGPVAGLMIHHQRDNLASFASAERIRDQRIRENACGAPTQSVEPAALECREYTDCDTGSRLVWCPHQLDIDGQGNNYPHQWPEGTAKEVIRFFEGL